MIEKLFVFDILFVFVWLFRVMFVILQNFDRISNNNIFVKLCMIYHITINCFMFLSLFCAWWKKSWNCVVREIFCNHYFLNAQFMFCFLIIFYEIHIKLIHINFQWNEMIIYRMIYYQIFVRKFLIYVCIFRFCQNVCNDFIYCNLWFCAHVKIWRNVSWHIYFTCSDFVQMFTTIHIL